MCRVLVLPSINRMRTASRLRVPTIGNIAGPSQVEKDYQAAIDLVGNEFLDTKARLLFKKVIAQFAAELEGDIG